MAAANFYFILLFSLIFADGVHGYCHSCHSHSSGGGDPIVGIVVGVVVIVLIIIIIIVSVCVHKRNRGAPAVYVSQPPPPPPRPMPPPCYFPPPPPPCPPPPCPPPPCGVGVNGKDLEDRLSLADCNIPNQSTLHLSLRLHGGGCPAYHIDSGLFDPGYDYDFTNTDDNGKTYKRGGKEYTRPIGAKRYAVKVLGRFGDNKWLDSTGNENTGECPVAYHGTAEQNVTNIIQQGFDINKGKRFGFGKGIYCTPGPLTAKNEYATQFEYKVWVYHFSKFTL